MSADLNWLSQQVLATSGRLAELNRVRRGLRLVQYKLDRRIAQVQRTQAMYAVAIEESRAVKVEGLTHSADAGHYEAGVAA